MKTYAPTVNLRLNTSRTNSDGTHPLFIHISWRGTRAKESARLNLTEIDFKKGVYRTARRLKARLDEIDLRIDELLSRGGIFTAQDVLERTSSPASDLDKLINEMAMVKRLTRNTFRTYRTAVSALRRYFGEAVRLADLTVHALQGFARSTGVRPSTMGCYLQAVNVMFNYAVDKGYVRENPMEKWRYSADGYKAGEKPRPKTEADITYYISIYETTKDKKLKEAIGIWLSGFYFNGLALCDLMAVDWPKVKKVTVGGAWYYSFSIRRKKTNQVANIMTPVIPLTEKLYAMLCTAPWAGRSGDAYRYFIGRQLRRIEPGLTYYTCRHSFANIMAKGRTPVNVIASMLGRSVNTISVYVAKVTEKSALASAASGLRGVELPVEPPDDIFIED